MDLGTGWSGMRTATVGAPAVTRSDTSEALLTIRVSGPGQNRSASVLHSVGDVLRHPLQLVPVVDEDGQCQPGRALLDGENRLHRRRIENIGAQAV